MACRVAATRFCINCLQAYFHCFLTSSMHGFLTMRFRKHAVLVSDWKEKDVNPSALLRSSGYLGKCFGEIAIYFADKDQNLSSHLRFFLAKARVSACFWSQSLLKLCAQYLQSKLASGLIQSQWTYDIFLFCVAYILKYPFSKYFKESYTVNMLLYNVHVFNGKSKQRMIHKVWRNEKEITIFVSVLHYTVML